MSLLFLTPLLLAVLVTVAGASLILRKKSLAQSFCVREAVQLQNELGKDLRKLIDLNPRAQNLRLKRLAAEQRLALAVATANPTLITAAQALRTAVITEQSALHLQQIAILVYAEQTRSNYPLRMQPSLRGLGATQFRSERASAEALAVFATPKNSLSPDYQTLPDFETRQSHKFSFLMNLKPPFELGLPARSLLQSTQCRVTLKKGGRSWVPKILEASVPSRCCS